MLALVVLASALIADAPPASPAATTPPTESAPREPLARSSADHLRRAYRCEADGDDAGRARHLALAVLADPTNASARGLLGLVAVGGRWVRAEAAGDPADRPGAAPLLAEYDRRRSAAAYTADAQFALGVWAAERGLDDQARAHFTAAVRLDPGHENARRRLGQVRRDGRWLPLADARAAAAEADARRRADRRWGPFLADCKGRLARPATRAEAEARLAAVTDPRALPAIARVFGDPADQPRAVQLLGQLDSAEASRALAHLAAFGASEPARRAATETLRRRDPREYADYLIGFLRDRTRYEVTPVAGPGSKGILRVAGEHHDVARVYAPPAPPYRASDRFELDPDLGRVVHRDGAVIATPWGYLADHRWGLAPAVDAVIARSLAERGPLPHTRFRFALTGRGTYSVAQLDAEAREAARRAQRQLLGDAAAIDRANASVDRRNDRFAAILAAAAGRSTPSDRADWSRWWVDLVGYRADVDRTDRATIVEQVPLDYVPSFDPARATFSPASTVLDYDRLSCFAAGTPVRTKRGPRPIEALAVGDLVLAQGTADGALRYRPVLATHRNPPGSTFRIRLGGDEIVASDFHRFWVAGVGWAMARDLKPGDRLRVLGAVLTIEAIAPGAVEPLFNLDVADDATFFAGRVAALVHDNTLPDPRLVPFDLPAAGAVAAR